MKNQIKIWITTSIMWFTRSYDCCEVSTNPTYVFRYGEKVARRGMQSHFVSH